MYSRWPHCERDHHIGREFIYDGIAKVLGRLQEEEFFLIFRQSIEDEMKMLLGESGMQSTFYHLHLEEVFRNPEELQRRLYSMFGTGSGLIERTVLLKLYQNIDVPFRERKGYGFAEYVDLASRAFSANKRGRQNA